MEYNANWPRLSVVTPSYNQGQFLEECIDSILSQNYPNLEYIIMDGGSSDNSVEIIKKYEKHLSYWQSQPDGGQYAAIQEGFRRSTGEIMTWLNSDDRFYPYAFGLIGLLYAQRPEVEWTMGLTSILDQASGKIGINTIPNTWSRHKYLNKQYKYPFIQQEGTFWRRSLWERSGACLRADLDLAGDLELWMRFFRHAQLYSLKFPTASYRMHGNQKAQLNLDKYFEEAEQILDEEIARFKQGQFTKTKGAPAAIPLSDIDVDFAEVCEVCFYADELIKQGERYFASGCLDGARIIFKRLQRISPDNPAGLNNLGVIAHQSGDSSGACAFFERALSADPRNRDALINLAELLISQNRTDEAAELMTAFLQLEPESSQICLLKERINPKSASTKTMCQSRQANPLVSVILPTKNRPADLRHAITSILSQTLDDYEIVVVNDGGFPIDALITDLNLDCRITCIDHAATSGMSAARNTAIKAARGRYIAYLNDDDIFYPNHLETLVKALEGGRVAYTDARMAIKEPADGAYRTIKTSVPYSIDFSRDLLMVHNIAPILCFMHEKSLFDECGLFDENLQSQEDWDLWLRMARLTDFIHIKATTAEFRRHCDRSSVTGRRNTDFMACTSLIYERNLEHINPDVLELRRQRIQQLEEELRPQEGYLLSAIVSTYNAERFLRDCLNDLENQTIADKLEIIVVDSGSQQNEAAIVHEFQQRHANIKYIRTTERETVYEAWNRGIKAANGRYLTNANTDDRHRADAFEIMVQALENRSDIDLVYANAYVSQTECPSFAPTSTLVRPPEFSLAIMVEGCFMGPQPMWRKAVHSNLGFFNEAYVSSGDYEFWCRMAFKGGCHLLHIDENLGVYYQNPTGVENSDLGLSKQEALIIRQCYLDYHRRQQGTPLADIVLCDIRDVAALERSVTTLIHNTASAFRLLVELNNPSSEALLYLKRHAVLFDGLTEATPALEGYLNQAKPTTPLNMRWPAGACAVHADWLERLIATFASHPEKDRLGLTPDSSAGRASLMAVSAVVAQRRALYGQPMPAEFEVVDGIRYGEAAARFTTAKLSSIIILIYNQLDYTKRCLDSVLKYTDTPYELILVDNASTDGTVAFLEKFAKGRANVRLILNETNTGFCHGNNQALEVSKGDYIVFLNNDVVVTENWLGRLIRHLEFGRGVSLVGPRSNSVAGSQMVQSVPYTKSLAEMHAYAQSFYAQHQGLARETIRLAGFCLLASRQLIDLIGGFDENYGSGNYKDDDLCLRSFVAGFRHLIAEDVFMHHYGSQTFIGNRIDHSEMLNVNRTYFEGKWAGLVRFIQQGDLVSYSLTEAAYDKATRLNLLMHWGEEAFDAGDLRRALKLFKFVLEIEPANQTALNNLGVMQCQMGAPLAGMELFINVLKREPGNQDALENLRDAMQLAGIPTANAEVLLNELGTALEGVPKQD